MEWRIERDSNNQTLVFAAEELARYIEKIDTAIETAILRSGSGKTLRNTLKLQIGGKKLPKVEDAFLDDAYCIKVINGAGVIEGSNPRSVLFGVYRLLYEFGCRWLRPGQDGEIIPKKSLTECAVNISEVASYRHRGVCIEGSCSFRHVQNMIDWLPKIGMNAYFMQFSTPFAFFDYWYRHTSNPGMEPQPASVDEITAMAGVLTENIKKRGLLYHATGHGWTCDPIGLRGLNWEKKNIEITDKQRKLMALVDGKRDIYKGVALNTNLCYSNPATKKKIVSAIVNLCRERREIDYLHFWLADEGNNHCECENCKDTIPADYYVQMLNEADSLLTLENIPVKIVFLVYMDLLWEPQKEKLINQDRFTLMFAPITRTYSKAFYNGDDTQVKYNLAPYVRNKLVMPESTGENVARLKLWQDMFKGDSFDFDYHLFWDFNYDPGGYESARILFEDMKNLDKLDLRGMMSCQVQRVFFPTGLAMNVMAAVLWNKNRTFNEVTGQFYADMFGSHAGEMDEYFKSLSKLFQPQYMRGEKEYTCEESAKTFEEIPGLLNDMMPKLNIRYQLETGVCKKKTWFALILHSQLCFFLAETMALKAKGDQRGAEASWVKTLKYANRIEPMLHELFDAKYFIDVVGRPVRGVGNWE